jgi:hypothetical protein
MSTYFDSPDRPNENACAGCGKFVANPAGDRCCEPASALDLDDPRHDANVVPCGD